MLAKAWEVAAVGAIFPSFDFINIFADKKRVKGGSGEVIVNSGPIQAARGGRVPRCAIMRAEEPMPRVGMSPFPVFLFVCNILSLVEVAGRVCSIRGSFWRRSFWRRFW